MDDQDEKLPKSVLSYYVQLYCKKRKTKRNHKNLIGEATRSWLNLSSSKRKIFTMKYDNCHLKLRKRFADKLRNAIPFSNKKQIDETSTHGISKSNSLNDVNSRHSRMDENLDDTNESLCSHDIPVQNHELNETCQEDQHNLSELPDTSIIEPCPPKFRSARELYYIINKNSEDIIPWEEITNTQKARYSQAGIRIKRLYLMEYTNYLENLSTKDLHALYKEIADT